MNVIPYTTEEAHAWLEARQFDPECLLVPRRRRSEANSHSERPHPLLVACEEGDLRMCEWLFLNGAHTLVSRASNHQWTPLSEFLYLQASNKRRTDRRTAHETT